jgi:hypothetical protein
VYDSSTMVRVSFHLDWMKAVDRYLDIPKHSPSETDLLEFLKMVPGIRFPNIEFWKDRRTFLASWSCQEGRKVTLEFFGNQHVQYDLWNRDPDTRRLVGLRGECHITSTKSVIDSYHMTDIVCQDIVKMGD